MQETFSELREKSGLTVQEVADACAMNISTVYRWERGESRPHPLAVEKLQEIARLANSPVSNKTSLFRYIDLFAGIGGFRKAFDAIGGKCVFTSEWDKNCRVTYQENYGIDHPVNGDIREYTKDETTLAQIPKHDVLVAGFPCQPFSIAGVSKKNALGREHGFKDKTQGTLFFDLVQIIEFHKPVAFLLENVKNLVSHNGGDTFKTIMHILQKDLKYKVKSMVIDGQHWVPQHRERTMIVGFREDDTFSFLNVKFPDESQKPKLADILHKPGDDDEFPFVIDGHAGGKYTLTEKLWNYLQRYKEKHQAAGNGFGFGLFGPNDIARTLSARYYKDGSEILISQGKGEPPRRLTPRECARLMGFDAPGESNFKIKVSDTQAYRQFGNSVVVPKAKAVAEAMLPHILAALKKSKSRKKKQPNLAA
jgi:DNA (cytosine-5)-methyltransferase 1